MDRNNSSLQADSFECVRALWEEVDRGGEDSAASAGDVWDSDSIKELSLDSSSHASSVSSSSVISSSTIVSSLPTSQSSESSPSTSGWVSSSDGRSASGRIPSGEEGVQLCTRGLHIFWN